MALAYPLMRTTVCRATYWQVSLTFPVSPAQVRILEAALRKKFDLDRRLRVWARPGVSIDPDDSIDLAKVSKEVPGKSSAEVNILNRVLWWLVLFFGTTEAGEAGGTWPGPSNVVWSPSSRTSSGRRLAGFVPDLCPHGGHRG